MNEYMKLLILSYFKEFKENYILSDLAKMLGTAHTKLDCYIENLIDEKLLHYDDGLLQITEKGLITLISKNMYDYSFADIDYLDEKVNKSEAWDIFTPYVPENFMDKI